MPHNTVGPQFVDQFLAITEAVAAARPDVDLEMAREVFHEVATLLHTGLALDGLDPHDASAVVAGLCVDLVAQGPGASVRARSQRNVGGSWKSARPGRCVRGLPSRGGALSALRNGPKERPHLRRVECSATAPLEWFGDHDLRRSCSTLVTTAH
jgi:hypothetical protein